MCQKSKHNKRDMLCFCCNELVESCSDLIKFKIENRRCKSLFDGCTFQVQLHINCAKEMEIDPEWFDNDICFEEATGKYKHEEYIVNLIESFIIENQEYIYNFKNYIGDNYSDESRNQWIEEFK